MQIFGKHTLLNIAITDCAIKQIYLLMFEQAREFTSKLRDSLIAKGR